MFFRFRFLRSGCLASVLECCYIRLGIVFIELPSIKGYFKNPILVDLNYGIFEVVKEKLHKGVKLT